MDRKEFEELVSASYGISADYPFDEDFTTAVFRHTNNRKWFAIAMRIPASRIGAYGEGSVDVVNLKCAPEVIESLVGTEPGVYPAYHMNKTHWITLSLEGDCDDATVEWLLGISYDLTRARMKNKGGH